MLKIRRLFGFGIAASAALAIATAGPASATPATYTLTSGRVQTIQLVDISPPFTPTPCPIGLGNCLVNAPLPITTASVTLDLSTNTLINVNIFVQGPGILAMNGLNNYQSVVFNGVTFQSSGATGLLPVGPQYNFASPGAISAASVDLFFLGNPGPIPNAVVSPYVQATTPTGNIVFSPGQIVLTLTGVDLGIFVDPLTGGNPVLAKADFVFSAAIPEPSAAVLYGVALLMTGTAVRRRAVVR